MHYFVSLYLNGSLLLNSNGN